MLARFGILTKVLAIVVLLSGIAAGMAYLGISALGQLNEDAERMQAAASRALTAARASQNVIVSAVRSIRATKTASRRAR